MIATRKIEDLTFDKNTMFLKIDGKVFRISIERASVKLVLANDAERGFYKISPSGYGIHWPLIDEDLSIDSLIEMAE
ncbi:DUF2442 domain-containing protein [Daejeonella sp.]|jgi:hypothetical protein|uniref:DUF2442 domain-containing protein n=1 Tax=Daejeonella sp. TaxID=2805397 RepID=UPI0025C5D3DA|nr:DUF2442 domain-containing protein [Daejeonella sp.]